MTRTLASFQVRERAGLRRFLYPMTGRIAWDPGHQVGMPRLRVLERTGAALPSQVDAVERWADGSLRSAEITFPVSIGPGDARWFAVVETDPADPAPGLVYDDPIALEILPDVIRTRQKQVEFVFDRTGKGLFEQVEYAGLTFLAAGGRGLGIRTAEGQVHWAAEGAEACEVRGRGPLAAGLDIEGRYPEGRSYRTSIRLTALKSWAHVWHAIGASEQADPGRTVSEVVIDLRLAMQNRVLYDAGLGGWIYGALTPEGAARIDFDAGRNGCAWEYRTGSRAEWQVEAQGRSAAHDGPSSQWLHWLDHPKSLAVAIPTPGIPGRMSIELDGTGGLRIVFRPDPAELSRGQEIGFGAVFHFLQDLPHIAARTNPQSILAPPLLDNGPRGSE